MTSLPTIQCRGCGKPIVFGDLPTGGKVPLDPKAPVYDVEGIIGGTVTATRRTEAMVTHFATCPAASNFTKQKAGAPSLADENADLRKQLQDARDDAARWKSLVPPRHGGGGPAAPY